MIENIHMWYKNNIIFLAQGTYKLFATVESKKTRTTTLSYLSSLCDWNLNMTFE